MKVEYILRRLSWAVVVFPLFALQIATLFPMLLIVWVLRGNTDPDEGPVFWIGPLGDWWLP